MSEASKEIPVSEGYLVEFKSFQGGVSVKELSKTICAFANTEGGTIYIGVTDSRLISGVKITPTLLDHVQNAAREGCSPPAHITLSELSVNDKKVLKIIVEKSGHLHSTASGQAYIRISTQDKRILGEEILRLAEQKSQVSYEDRLLDYGAEVIDKEALSEYYLARKSVSPLRGRLNDESLLAKVGLAKEENNKTKIRAGAFVLFGREGEQILPQRDFIFVKYDADGKMYSHREDISMPAHKLLERLMELIRQHNKYVDGTSGLIRQEKYLYPEEAIREALTNALAHRDYRLSGLRNECRIYPDRMEIISAGCLPGFITLENIDKRHYSRNSKIMHALVILGLVEELGQGINLMKRALTANGNPPPEFAVHPDQFKVVFRRPKKSLSEIDIKKILDGHFSSHKLISRKQIESMCGIGSTSAKYAVEELINEGYLIKVGAGPTTKYEKVKK